MGITVSFLDIASTPALGAYVPAAVSELVNRCAKQQTPSNLWELAEAVDKLDVQLADAIAWCAGREVYPYQLTPGGPWRWNEWFEADSGQLPRFFSEVRSAKELIRSEARTYLGAFVNLAAVFNAIRDELAPMERQPDEPETEEIDTAAAEKVGAA